MFVSLIGLQSRVENLDLGSIVCHRLCPPKSLSLKTSHKKCNCFTDTWIHLSGPAIKCLSDPGKSNSTIQPCFSSICPLECFQLRRTLNVLSFCYEDLERLEEFLCIG